jgi:hypothetical protein
MSLLTSKAIMNDLKKNSSLKNEKLIGSSLSNQLQTSNNKGVNQFSQAGIKYTKPKATKPKKNVNISNTSQPSAVFQGDNNKLYYQNEGQFKQILNPQELSSLASRGVIQSGQPYKTLPNQTGQNVQASAQKPQEQAMATLINPQTGDRKAVGVGSQDAQILFGKGYSLENNPETKIAQSMASNTPNAPAQKPMTELERLQQQINEARSEITSALTPSGEEQLLRERINTILNQRDTTVSELEKTIANLAGQGRGISAGLVTGQQGAVANQANAINNAKTAEANALNRTLETLLGQRQSEIGARESELGFLENSLAREMAEQQRQEQLNLSEQDQKRNLALQAIQGGATQADVESIINSTDFASALGIAGEFIRPSQSTAPITLSEGSILVDPNTGQVLAKNSKTNEYSTMPVNQNGQYSLTFDQAQNINKDIAKNDSFKALVKVNDAWRAIDNYSKIFDKVGTQKYGKDATELKTAYTNALLAMKEFHNLGVITGPDLELMQNILVDPEINWFEDPLKKLGVGGEEGIKEGINQVKEMFTMSILESYNSLKTTYGQFDSTNLTNLQNLERKVDQFIADDPDFSISIYKKQNPELENEINEMLQETTSTELAKFLWKSDFNNDLSKSQNDSIVNIAEAIAIQESGGNYNARGPVVQSGMYKGERALGKYQIMPGNLPSWSMDALGYEVTPEEFMESPQLQDAIAHHRLNIEWQKYGNPEDVASVWFSGRPLSKAGNASDVTGTTVPRYVQNVIYNLNQIT